jgi:N-acetylglutamate synthase-like GNAT family acetyltransferase
MTVNALHIRPQWHADHKKEVENLICCDTRDIKRRTTIMNLDAKPHQRSSITLTPYATNMQSDIESFYKECFEALGWVYEPQGRHNDTINIPEVYLKTGQFWCLYDDKRLVGTVAVRTIDAGKRVAEMKRLYIAPSRQGEGFGSLLFETALQYVKNAGFAKICVDTRHDRDAARHLINKHGFKEISKYNENAFAELFFELDLK